MPTLAASYFVNTTTGATLVTTSFTPAVGEVIVVKAVGGDSITCVLATPTGGGLTYTLRKTDVSSSRTGTYIWTTTTTSATSMTVSVARSSGSNNFFSMLVERWTSAALAGTPATNATTTGSGAPSSTITTTGTSSVVSWLNGDWAAVSPTGRTYQTTSATPTDEGVDNQSPTQYVAYYAWQAAASAGSQTVGLTAPSGQTWTLLAIEIQAGASTPIPRQPTIMPPPAMVRAGSW